MGLDLYATVEHLLGFEEQKEQLYSIYLEKLQQFGAKRVLDIGCGSGRFMDLAKAHRFEIVGIDLSPEMVKRAKAKGLACHCEDICRFEGNFDVAVAIFDVLNYLENPKPFLACVQEKLQKGGYFVADINTLYGFEEVAQGSLWIDTDNEFVAIDALYEERLLRTELVYFKREQEVYVKQKDTIIQYYHEIDDLKIPGLELVAVDFVSLFGDETDKAILTFQKV